MLVKKSFKSIDTAKAQGHSEAFIAECLGYAHNLISHNMPVIFDVPHLSILLGIEVGQIYAIIINIDDNYKKYSIRKKSGGKRDICAPKPILIVTDYTIRITVIHFFHHLV